MEGETRDAGDPFGQNGVAEGHGAVAEKPFYVFGDLETVGVFEVEEGGYYHPAGEEREMAGAKAALEAARKALKACLKGKP